MSLYYGLVIVTIFLLLLYRYLTCTYDYWKKQGVETAASPIPGFGHTLSVLCLRESLSDVCDRLYKSCSPDASMLGMFHLRTPVLMIRDPELVKTVLVKKFSSFQNNLMHLDEDRDWFLSKHPFLATGATWRENRTRLISGMSARKLKVLLEPVKRVCAKFDEHLDQILVNSQAEVEIKSLCLKVTSEIVCNAGLGIEDEQRFANIAGKIFESSWSNATRLMLNFFLPAIAAASRVSFASKEVRKYFADLTKNVFESRQVERKKKKNEQLFLDMVMYGEVDEETVAGLVSSFFFEAFESAASIASFTLYRLSQHPDVQKKLQMEIHDTLAKYDGNITYDALKEMTYLQQVINECIRLHMTLEISAKICNKTTTLQGSDGQICTLEPGHIVIIPAQSMHTDEKFWHDPFTFDPGRFDNDKKNEIIKYAYLPFGEGPRMCPGIRFGLLEVKTLLITVLRKCTLKLSTKTTTPLKMDPLSFLLSVKGGLWTKLERA